MTRFDFLKEKLVEAEERVRSLEVEIAEDAINREKIRELEAQLLAAETDNNKTADLTKEFTKTIESLSGDLVIIGQPYLLSLLFFLPFKQIFTFISSHCGFFDTLRSSSLSLYAILYFERNWDIRFVAIKGFKVEYRIPGLL